MKHSGSFSLAKRITLLICFLVSSSSFRAQNLYKPFSSNLDSLALIDTSFQLILYDTLSGECILMCSEFNVEVEKKDSNSYKLSISTWNPSLQRRSQFLNLYIKCFEFSYEMIVDTLSIPDFSNELEGITPDSSNVEQVGYKSIAMLIKTMDIKYLHLVKQCMEIVQANTDLIWYFDFLESINVTNHRIWRYAGLGSNKEGLIRVGH